MRLLVVVTFAALVTAASTARVMSGPRETAVDINEDDFEEYFLSKYYEYLERNVNVSAVLANGCTINIRRDLYQLQPVYIKNGRYLSPRENSGLIRLNTNEQVTIACTGDRNYIRHPQFTTNLQIGNIQCVSGVRVRWQNSQIVSDFKNFTCNVQPIPDTPNTLSSCWNNKARLINVGFTVQKFIGLYSSCFDDLNLVVLYVSYPQTRENYIYQPHVDRPYFKPGTFFPVDINRLYTYTTHKNTIAGITGKYTYINNVYNITRGHLAAKTDFVFATGQSSTFWYINAAPQWSTINSGNWETLEKNLRARIANAGYNTMIYTGTLGVTTLRHIDNNPRRIYLDPRGRVPVPEYFYKLVHEAGARKGTVFITINNPYYTVTEAVGRQFCTNVCDSNNGNFSWIKWQPKDMTLGYSFCCSINDFRNGVETKLRLPLYLPDFGTSNDLLF